MNEKSYNELHQWTKQYIDDLCIVRNTRMPGKIPGTSYSWIFYLRRGLFNHQFLSAISQMFYYQVSKHLGHFNFQIAGLETASTPLLAGIPLIGRALGHDINAFSIRKERKQYGLRNWIEGLPNDLPVLLVDDLCNSSDSLYNARAICEQERIQCCDTCFVIVNKTNDEQNVTDKYMDTNIRIISLFNLSDFGLTN